MASVNKINLCDETQSKVAGATLTCDPILLPAYADDVLLVTKCGLSGQVEATLQHSPDGVRWSNCQVKKIESSSGTASFGNEWHLDTIPKASEVKNKHLLQYSNFGGVTNQDVTTAFMAHDKPFNLSMWIKSNVAPSATYSPILFRCGGKVEATADSNDKALYLNQDSTDPTYGPVEGIYLRPSVTNTNTSGTNSTLLTSSDFETKMITSSHNQHTHFQTIYNSSDASGQDYAHEFAGETFSMWVKFDEADIGTADDNDGAVLFQGTRYHWGDSHAYPDEFDMKLVRSATPTYASSAINPGNTLLLRMGVCFFAVGGQQAQDSSGTSLGFNAPNLGDGNWHHICVTASLGAQDTGAYTATSRGGYGFKDITGSTEGIDFTHTSTTKSYSGINRASDNYFDLGGVSPEREVSNSGASASEVSSHGLFNIFIDGENINDHCVHSYHNLYGHTRGIWGLTRSDNLASSNILNGTTTAGTADWFTTPTIGSGSPLLCLPNVSSYQIYQDAGRAYSHTGNKNCSFKGAIKQVAWMNVCLTKHDITNYPNRAASNPYEYVQELYNNGKPLDLSAGDSWSSLNSLTYNVDGSGNYDSTGTSTDTIYKKSRDLLLFLDFAKIDLTTTATATTASTSASIFKDQSPNENQFRFCKLIQSDCPNLLDDTTDLTVASSESIFVASIPEHMGDGMTISITDKVKTDGTWNAAGNEDPHLLLSFDGFENDAAQWVAWKCSQTDIDPLLSETTPANLLDGTWHNLILSYRGVTSAGDSAAFGRGGVGGHDSSHWHLGWNGLKTDHLNSYHGVDAAKSAANGQDVTLAMQDYHLKNVSDTYVRTSLFASGFLEDSVDSPYAFQGQIDETSFDSSTWWRNPAPEQGTFCDCPLEVVYGNNDQRLTLPAGTANDNYAFTLLSLAPGKPHDLLDPLSVNTDPINNQKAYIDPYPTGQYRCSDGIGSHTTKAICDANNSVHATPAATNWVGANANFPGGIEWYYRWGDIATDCKVCVNDARAFTLGVSAGEPAVAETVTDRSAAIKGTLSVGDLKASGTSNGGSAETIYVEGSSGGGGTTITYEDLVNDCVLAGDNVITHLNIPHLHHLRLVYTGSSACNAGDCVGDLFYSTRRK